MSEQHPGPVPASITVAVTIARPLAEVWKRYAAPEDVTQWNQASPDWHCPRASTDLRVGGAFSWRMEARDGSFGFDFGGTYTAVELCRRIAYVLGDGRSVQVAFESLGPASTQVTERFDAEAQNSVELQRQGWQAILESFKRHCEGQPSG